MMACASACPDGPAVAAALHMQLLSASQNTSGATDIYQNGRNARQNGHVLSLRVSSALHTSQRVQGTVQGIPGTPASLT